MMKTEIRNLSVFAVLVVSMLFSPLSVRADHMEDIEDLTDDLEEITDELDEEFEDHYEDSRSYDTLESRLKRIDSKRSRIHKLSRRSSTTDSVIQEEIAELDQMSHDLHEFVDQLEKDTGKYLFRMFGDTRKVHSLLAAMEKNIHSMQNRAAASGQGSKYGYQSSGNQQQSRYGYPTTTQSRHTYPAKPSNSHSYPGSNQQQHQHDTRNSQSDEKGGNLFQRIHRGHMKIRDSILGKN